MGRASGRERLVCSSGHFSLTKKKSSAIVSFKEKNKKEGEQVINIVPGFING